MYRKKRYLLLLVMLMGLLLCAGSVKASETTESTESASTTENVVKTATVVSGGQFVTKTAGLKYCYAEGGYAKNIWLNIDGGIKSLLGVVVGLQTVQCLVTPAVDSLKNSALSRMISVIPGIGSVLSAAAETVAGSAVVIKNAVGVAGILALLMICLAPLVKLAVCVLLFRLICAAIQPVCEKRMVEGIESISDGTLLLLRVLLSVLAMFAILLAMITAAVRGA